MDDIIQRYVLSLEWIRKKLLDMDRSIGPIMGINDWDDATCIKFGNKKLIASIDGPYTKRLVMKSALIHAATDVIVKGAKPLFALDALIGNQQDLSEMISSLKNQARAMKIPILGGNTLFEDIEPRCTITVIGELIKNPIRDSTAKGNDIIALLGNPIWGSQKERIKIARILFKTWFKILNSGIKINASKDVTKGGILSVFYEMSKKSKKEFKINEDLPFPLARNLDNFLITLSESEYQKIIRICKNYNCGIYEIGRVI